MQGILLNSLQLQALPCQNNLNFIENLIFVGIIAQYESRAYYTYLSRPIGF